MRVRGVVVIRRKKREVEMRELRRKKREVEMGELRSLEELNAELEEVVCKWTDREILDKYLVATSGRKLTVRKTAEEYVEAIMRIRGSFKLELKVLMDKGPVERVQEEAIVQVKRFHMWYATYLERESNFRGWS